MQLQFLVLAAVTLAAKADSQCGLNQLTTPPAFVSNGGGAVGGMVYFTLDVLAANGISICGIDVNTTTSGGINGLVYLHQSITDWNLLTSANNTPADWCSIACLSGTGNPIGTPSPMSVINGTNSIDLPQGQYLLGIGNGNFNHRYTNGNGANQTISDGNLVFDSGKTAHVAFTGSLFTPRVFNATFDYDVAAAAVTLSPCGATCIEATCVTNGTGCGGVAATVLEQFNAGNAWDLSANDLLFVANGSGTDVISLAGTAILPAVGPDLGLGDDESSELIPLGFPLGAFGVCADSISVQSNGCIWLGAQGSGDFSESIGEFESEQARLAPYWNDLSPLTAGGGGTIHADVVSGLSVTVTYDQVFIWGSTVPLTFQVEITPALMHVRYDPASAFASSAIVGLHNGVAQAGTPSTDLNGGGTISVSGNPALTLSCDSLPLAGGTFLVTLSGVPAGGLGAVLAEHMHNGAGALLPSPPWATNCTQYISNNHVSLGLATACNSQFSIALPPAGTMFLGIPYGLQGAAISLIGPFQLTASNGVDAVLGNY